MHTKLFVTGSGTIALIAYPFTQFQMNVVFHRIFISEHRVQYIITIFERPADHIVFQQLFGVFKCTFAGMADQAFFKR